MYKRIHPGAALAILASVIFTANYAFNGKVREASADQVLASFERELNHEPAPARPVTRESIDHDVLYRTVNAVHWTRDEQMKKAVETCVPPVLDPPDGDFDGPSRYRLNNTYPCIAEAISSGQSME